MKTLHFKGITNVLTLGAQYILLVVIWEVCVRFFKIPNYILPSPISIGNDIYKHFWLLMINLYITLYETLLGFALAVAGGILIAILIAFSDYFRRTFYPIVVGTQAVPKVAVAPLLVTWFGYDILSKVMMSFLISFFPIVINVLAGLYDINPTLLELMKSIRANKWQIFLKIRVPNALPYLMDGMKIALPLSVVGAIVGEFIGAKAGMGNLILITQTALNTSLTFAALVTITVVSLLLFYVVSWFDRRFIWWRAV